MTTLAAPPRAVLRALVAGAVSVMAVLASAGHAEASDPVTAVLDRTNAEPVEVPPQTERAQNQLRRSLGEGGLLETDPVTGTPRVVARLNGFLTPPSSDDPETIAVNYVRDHAGAFGLDGGDLASLHLTSSDRAPDGTVHLRWEQRAGGLPNVDGGLHAAVTADGQLLNVRGGVVPDLDKDTPEPLVSAAAAYATALPGSASAPPASVPSGAERETSFAGGGKASLTRYQDDGKDRLGWRLLVPGGSDAFYDALVDARTGRLQRRINRVRFASAINQFDVNPQEENGTSTRSVIPAHWLAPTANRLSGPYVHAISDLDDSIDLADGGPPFVLTEEPVTGDEVAPRSVVATESQWDFEAVFGPSLGFCTPLCSWRGSNRTANRDFSTAQLFWYVNTFRDYLAKAPIGFTAASGGFEGDDPVLAQSLDGALTEDPGPASLPDEEHRDNASMLTLPDGNRGLMEVNLFSLVGRYDGTHDASLIFHEYTHGLTDRLVVDGNGFATAFGAQGSALAEGISDFYALDFLAATQPEAADTATPGELRFGSWLGELRTEGVDCVVDDAGPNDECPGTVTAGPGGYGYDDFGTVHTSPEIHADGEIWAQTLWSIRSAITGADRLARVRGYVTDGLRLAPDFPSFLDMRNAILQAAFNAARDQDLTTLWQVFASRGMGWSARTTGADDTAPVAAFDMPPPPVLTPPPPPPPPTPTPTPTPTPDPGPVAKVTSLSGAKITADRKGLFKVKVRFGDAVSAGNARFTVTRKGKRLARAKTPVRLGKTVTKTLRLTKKGRNVIRRGRSKKVTLELRLPDGKKMKKTVTLERKKR